MRINNKNFKDVFNCDVVSFDDQPMQIKNEIFIPILSYRPIALNKTINPKQKKLIIDFENEVDISDLTKEIMEYSLIDIDDGFLYDCFLESSPTINQEGIKAFTVSFTLLVIKKGKEQEILINKNCEVFILGNYEAEPVIEFTPLIDMAYFEINGIRINNLHANYRIVLDSVKKTIQENGVNKFKDCNIKRWPKLEPGNNKIIISSAEVEVILKYDPIYL